MNRTLLVCGLTLLLHACGGGGGSNSSDEISNDTTASTASEIIKALDVTISDQIGRLVEGRIPSASTSLDAPSVKSSPDSILTSTGDIERVDILFDTEFGISEILIGIADADSYLRIDNPNTEAIVNNAEVISLWFGISENIRSGDFCVEISGMDTLNSISGSVDVCFSIVNGETDSRVIYFADFSVNSTLSTLDFDTGDVTAIGPTGVQLTDIGFLNGQLYGVTFTDLISLDKETGNSSVIGSIGNGGINALVGRNGMLFSMSTTGEYFQIDPTTGTASNIRTIGSGAYSSGDFVFNADGTILWGTVVVPGFSTDHLIQIETETDNVTIVGETGFAAVYGLAYLRGQLLGLTAAGEFIIIDPETGNGTLVENTDAFSAGGAASE
ncbi:MAG: hypothetical protein AB2712_01335 [Candidatus Thiodiazotropha sp.]